MAGGLRPLAPRPALVLAASALSLSLSVTAQDLLRRELDPLVRQLLRQHRVPGLALAVVRDGALLWAEGYGVADRESGRPVTADTVFNAGSISKAVTAWVVMGQVEAGQIDLDAPVEDSLQRWSFPESSFDSRGVTVRRLLSHTAGLNMHSIPGFALGRELPRLEDILAGAYSDSEYTEGGTALRLLFEPGSRWSYSGGGFVLLELLLEEASGTEFARLAQREVLTPLGMEDSRFGWSEDLRERAATPYRSDGEPYGTYRFRGTSGAGLYTTVVDLARFAAAILPAGDLPPGRSVLAPATVERMQVRQNPVGDAPGRSGLGYFLEPPGRPVREVLHSGSNNGWQGIFITLPDHGRALAVLTNSDNAGPVLPRLVCAWAELEIDVVLSGCR